MEMENRPSEIPRLPSLFSESSAWKEYEVETMKLIETSELEIPSKFRFHELVIGVTWNNTTDHIYRIFLWYIKIKVIDKNL